MTSILRRLSEPSAACQAWQTLHPAGIEIGAEIEAEFGGDHDPVTDGREGFAQEFFVRERAVDLGSVEKRDAAFHGCAEKRNHLPLVFGRSVGKAHAHTAESEGRYFQAVIAKFSRLHYFFLLNGG